MNVTRVVMLGTGNPIANPDKSGPGVAIIVDDKSYLVDFGPGIVRQASKASIEYDIEELKPKNLKITFLTHLHSDHTSGLPDLILSPWVLGRKTALKVFGPKGVSNMCEKILSAYEVDINGRLNGLEPANKEGYKVESTEISEGTIYRDDSVVVEAFLVKHPPFESYGYKFTTKDKVVVISGDTAPCENLINYSKGCDILVHEVYSHSGFKTRPESWQEYHSNVHTSSLELGYIANETNSKILVLYHQLYMLNLQNNMQNKNEI